MLSGCNELFLMEEVDGGMGVGIMMVDMLLLLKRFFRLTQDDVSCRFLVLAQDQQE